jgi:hypothetical protein
VYLFGLPKVHQDGVGALIISEADNGEKSEGSHQQTTTTMAAGTANAPGVSRVLRKRIIHSDVYVVEVDVDDRVPLFVEGEDP